MDSLNEVLREDDHFTGFMEVVFKYMSDPQSFDVISDVRSFAQANRLDTEQLVRDALRSTLFVLRSSLQQSHTPVQIQQRLCDLGLDPKRAELIRGLWKQHYVAMSRMAKQEISVNRLVDVEWKFGVTAATDELEKVGATYLQLKLVVDKGSSGFQDVTMELSLEEFYSFLASMQRAKQQLG